MRENVSTVISPLMYVRLNTTWSHSLLSPSFAMSSNHVQGSCRAGCGSRKDTGSPGFQPSVWGPGMWLTLHTITLNYPARPTPQDQQWYQMFFQSLGHVLPCAECQKHFTQYYNTTMGSTPMKYLYSRQSLSLWLYNLHNLVNSSTGKRNKFKTYEEMVAFYQQFTADASHSWRTTVMISRA